MLDASIVKHCSIYVTGLGWNKDNKYAAKAIKEELRMRTRINKVYSSERLTLKVLEREMFYNGTIKSSESKK